MDYRCRDAGKCRRQQSRHLSWLSVTGSHHCQLPTYFDDPRVTAHRQQWQPLCSRRHTVPSTYIHIDTVTGSHSAASTIPTHCRKPGTHWWQSWIWHSRLGRKSTQSTVSLWPSTHWRQSRKDVRHLGDKNYPLSTKLTELNMFNFGYNWSQHNWQSRTSPWQLTFDKHATNQQQSQKNRWQIGDKADSRLSLVCTGL